MSDYLGAEKDWQLQAQEGEDLRHRKEVLSLISKVQKLSQRRDVKVGISIRDGYFPGNRVFEIYNASFLAMLESSPWHIYNMLALPGTACTRPHFPHRTF